MDTPFGLHPYLPPIRKIWKSEDSRMGLFDAAALALTFFHQRRDPKGWEHPRRPDEAAAPAGYR